MQPLQEPEKGAVVAAGLIGILVLLTPCTVLDLRKKKLPVIYIGIFLAAAVVINLVTGRIALWEMIFGILYGGVFLLISVLTKGAIGFGDGVMISAAGAWTGVVFTMTASIFAFLSAGIFGLIYIKVKKMDRKTKFPFAPFFLFNCLWIGVLEWITGG